MQTLKILSTALLTFSLVIGILLFTGNTYGYGIYMKPAFYVAGGIGLLLTLASNRKAVLTGDYNILFWLGNLIIFVGLVMKTYGMVHGMTIVFAGLGISMLAFFYNPFAPRPLTDDDPDNPLDQL